MGTKTQQLSNSQLEKLSNQIVDWQAVKTSDFTAVAGQGYFVNTTSGAVEVTLPSSAIVGDTISIKDYAGTFATNNLNIARNGHKVQGQNQASSIITNRANVELVYIDSTKGWLFTNESNVGDLQTTNFITATGGTITTVSTNFKVHTFTGDGCFVVSQIGSGTAPSAVDYLVIAGGASGGKGGANDGGGGGGAGGYRESAGTVAGPYSVSPLGACVAALTVAAQTYPVTVGGGAANIGAGCTVGNSGSNSVFSTITSAGGGAGDANGTNSVTYAATLGPGGSGGGGHQNSGGNGNTPPVSPPQGNNGGASVDPAGSGGGGATAVGGNAPGNNGGGAGGAGATSCITASPVARGGGGGGASSPTRPSVGPNGAGGAGGGASGGGGSSATANTGGAGGGGHSGNSGSGGSGVVIIRYKFQ